MAFPSEYLADVLRGKSMLSELDAEDTANIELGCSSCTVKNYDCLTNLLDSIDMKIDLDQYDDVAIGLYEKMLLIIGDFTLKVPPTVNAGADQSVPINETAYFSATIVPGSAAIVSIQWSIVSGSGTLINSTTANVIVQDFPIGGTVLKVVVTDANGLKASDTVILTGEAVPVTIRVYYLFQDTNDMPDETTILSSSFVNVAPDSDYIVPVDVLNGEARFVFIFEPNTETYKARWEDVIDPDNGGLIGAGKTWNNTDPVGSFRGYATEFKTQFPNPIQMIKGTPQP